MKRFSVLFILMLVSALFLIDTSAVFGFEREQTISVTIPVAAHEIENTMLGQELYIDGYGYWLIPGKPKLPSRIFALAIPSGAEFIEIDFTIGEGVSLPGNYDIPPTPLTRVIGEENPASYEREKQRYEENFSSVYGSDKAYPQKPVEFVRTAGYREYNLVDVRVTPFEYRPLSKQLVYYPEITIDIKYGLPDRTPDVVLSGSNKIRRRAEEIILNYNQAQNWYPSYTPADRDLNDFVIITLSSLTSSITSLVDWETQKGKAVEVVTTAWINSNYTGYDLAEKMRNFLREKYPWNQWGIENVLLIGHYDNVPMRRTYQDIGFGMPETDYYYAELSYADNLSWDANGNHQYGEDSDPIDFYGEVNVGRIPWSDPAIVQHICEKSVAYEQNDDPAYKKNILLLGAFFWDDDPNPRTDNAELMEAKVDQTWMADWTMTRLYEQGYSTFPMDYNLNNSNTVSIWSSGTYGFVNWAGHGSPTSSHIYHSTGEAFISSSNCPLLNDDYPAIIFADACSNSDTDYLNIGQAMMQRGGVGFVGATKVALGYPGWNSAYDGSSQSLDYFFTKDVTFGEYTQGEAHQRALTTMYTYGLWSYNKYETFEWGALWGNPDLGMSSVITYPLRINLPDSTPGYLEPSMPTTFTVQIEAGSETYLPGTGRLHYRYEDGAFSTSNLALLSGDLFEATLPAADCEDMPEFYISASGNSGSTVLNPPDAPASVYSAPVGMLSSLMEDNFETDQGWTVSGDAADGHWERAVPIGGGDRGDPLSDFDGSGYCYVTDNEDGNSDIDDGTTYLISPTIDSDGLNANISFALWYSNNIGGDPNNDLFKVWISNNDGQNWTLIATFGPVTVNEWIEYSFDIADFVTPTANVKLRFEASDLNEGSVVEAAVDAISIKIIECEEAGYAYLPGDVNMYDETWPPSVVGGDVTYLVNYFRGSASSTSCLMDGFWASADVNGDCNVVGSDVTKLVNYFRGNESISYCADYEPLWLNPEDLPPDAPSSWPNCGVSISRTKIQANSQGR